MNLANPMPSSYKLECDIHMIESCSLIQNNTNISGFFSIGFIEKPVPNEPALRVMLKRSLDDKRKLVSESQVLETIAGGPNIIGFYGLWEVPYTGSPEFRFIKEALVFEHSPGSLDSEIRARFHSIPSRSLVSRVGSQILTGLDYLHSRDLVLRNLIPAGILIVYSGTELVLKLSNFSQACSTERKNTSHLDYRYQHWCHGDGFDSDLAALFIILLDFATSHDRHGPVTGAYLSGCRAQVPYLSVMIDFLAVHEKCMRKKISGASVFFRNYGLGKYIREQDPNNYSPVRYRHSIQATEFEFAESGVEVLCNPASLVSASSATRTC